MVSFEGTFGVQQGTSTLQEVAEAAVMADVQQYEVAVDGAAPGGQQDLGGGDRSVPAYTFCTPSAQWSQRLLSEVPVPGCIARSDNPAEDSGVGSMDPASASWPFEIQFYLGSANTGAPVHFHGPAINSLAYGEKVFFCTFIL
jgi:hypothetical protein